jgi:hypothetical protein
MDSTETSTDTVPAAVADEGKSVDDMKPDERIQLWLANIQRCESVLRDVVPEWSTNIDYRRGKPFAEDSDLDRIRVPIDWSMTKAKQAQLFSQVPEVRLTHKTEAYKAVAPMFAKKLNDQLCESRVGVALDEVMPDCINAAGFGAALVAFESKTERRSVPIPDPQQAAQMAAAGMQIPMQDVEVVLDSRFLISRISPEDFLWEVAFTGSDFDDAPWIGRKGRKTWDEAIASWDKLTEADKSKVVGADARKSENLLTNTGDENKKIQSGLVNYRELFYWRHMFHADETDYRAIHHLVFIEGKKEPVVDEPWKGQKRNAKNKIIGPRRMPIRVLTLTYISNESIPPSDSAMGRPQVDELNRSRSQMIRNRETSVPLRWFNTNLVDPQVQTQMMRGTWQGMIPINGTGDRAFGEVARAAYPNEDFMFDNIAKADARETWQVQDAIEAGPAIRSAAEANNRQQNFQTRIGYERARCAAFLVGIAEVLAGLVALFGEFTQEEMQLLGQLPKEELASYYAFNVRADSTLLLDAEQRIQRLMTFLNMTAKSGYVDVAPVIMEIVELVGLDPAVVIHQPQGKGPEPVNASLRLTGAADLSDPVVIAMLMHAGQFPTAEELNAAKIALATIQQQPELPQPEGGPGGAPGGPGGPGGAPGAPPPPGAPPAGAPPPQAPGGRPVAPAGSGRPAEPYTAHPNWNTASRVEKRAEDGK